MAVRQRPAGQPDSPERAARSIQGSLAFERPAHGRDETELLHALSRALSVLVQSGGTEDALRETFVHAMAGLDAEKGVLVEVRRDHPLELDILYATGLSAENEEAFRSLRSSPGISPTVIQKAVDSREPRLVENSQFLGLDATASLHGRPYSVLCAPVMDSLTGAVIAVLYFQNEARRAFGPEDLEWITAYAAALGQALTLHVSGQRRLRELESEWRRQHDAAGPEIVGSSDATKELIETLNILLPSTTRSDAPPILVTGESGTGKELVARYLHHYSPRRARGPFQPVNCAALRGDLAETRLFGHVRGAFTGAQSDAAGLFRAADKGTLFLDEIGELSPDGQALVLRILETRSVQPVGDHREVAVDVQLVLATNRNLEDEVVAGRFREDLYYRVSGLLVRLAPLRDPARISDIRTLLAFYLARHERQLKKKTMGLTPSAFRSLLQFAWPGNVRQLNNVCLSLVTHAPAGAWIDVADLQRLRPEIFAGPRNPNPEAFLEDENVAYGDAIRAFRKKLILDRLRRHGNNVSSASASLGISEPTFYRYWTDAKRIL
jgi:transcriptional regulator with GAF, ATPase, and Fis domain